MKLKNVLLISIILFITTPVLYAQVILTEENKIKIILKLDSLIVSDYVNPDKAKLAHEKLQELLKDPRFLSIKDEKTLESAVNMFLQQATSDGHLRFYYDKKKYNLFLKPQEEIRKGEAEQFSKINFGLQKIEILPGNIGYIKINKFQNLNDVIQTAAGAMEFIRNADAIIFDLRNNGGGDGRTGKLFLDYFVKDTSSSRLPDLPLPQSFKLFQEDVQLCVLIGKGTFSAAEGFTKDVLAHKRGIAIGEQTKGGGNSGGSVPLYDGFLVFLPTEVASSEIEGKGITPSIAVNERDALIKAQEIILTNLQTKASISEEKESYNWFLESLIAESGKIDVGEKLLKSYTGKFQGENEILLKNKDLFLKRGDHIFKLLPISNNYFIISDFDDFGKGNARIRFESKDKAVFILNQGIASTEKVFKKL
jgi:hypothetical protein